MTTAPTTPITQYQSPAEDDAEADKRYERTISVDPFPAIAPSLLNSSDIFHYVCATGMVHPYVPELLKSASYAARVGEKFVYWNENGDLEERNLKEDEVFDLKPNSIAFITTEEKFRLPDYMAIRFNLKINNVHRGILLGTGPIVDPGFVGHLLVPLHNLTTNVYRFRRGEKVIWIEFTKTSPNRNWDPRSGDVEKYYRQKNKFVPFPDHKKNLKVWDYFEDAHKGPIRSSIPETLKESLDAAKTAKETTRYVSIGAIAVVASAFIGGAELINDLRSDIRATETHAREIQAEVSALQNRIRTDLQSGLADERQERTRLFDEISSALGQIEKMVSESNDRISEDNGQ